MRYIINKTWTRLTHCEVYNIEPAGSVKEADPTQIM
jgi:hypothetical protein